MQTWTKNPTLTLDPSLARVLYKLLFCNWLVLFILGSWVYQLTHFCLSVNTKCERAKQKPSSTSGKDCWSKDVGLSTPLQILNTSQVTAHTTAQCTNCLPNTHVKKYNVWVWERIWPNDVCTGKTFSFVVASPDKFGDNAVISVHFSFMLIKKLHRGVSKVIILSTAKL